MRSTRWTWICPNFHCPALESGRQCPVSRASSSGRCNTLQSQISVIDERERIKFQGSFALRDIFLKGHRAFQEVISGLGAAARHFFVVSPDAPPGRTGVETTLSSINVFIY